MASLREKVEAELEQMDQALRALPGARRVSQLSVLELGGTASLLSSLYHGVENILKQGLLASELALPSGAAWHRDLLQLACERGLVSTDLRDRLVPYMAFRHFFTHAYGFDLRSTTAGAAGSGYPLGVCLLQERGETVCAYAGGKARYVQISGRAVTGKGPSAESGKGQP